MAPLFIICTCATRTLEAVYNPYRVLVDYIGYQPSQVAKWMKRHDKAYRLRVDHAGYASTQLAKWMKAPETTPDVDQRVLSTIKPHQDDDVSDVDGGNNEENTLVVETPVGGGIDPRRLIHLHPR